MKIYLAACFEQQAEIRDKAVELERLLITCTSRWRFEDGTLPPTPEHLHNCATMDLEDIHKADYFVCLTNQTSQRGGKHVELGYALAISKPVMIVGRRENIFHSLKQVQFVETWDAAICIIMDAMDEIKRVNDAD